MLIAWFVGCKPVSFGTEASFAKGSLSKVMSFPKQYVEKLMLLAVTRLSFRAEPLHEVPESKDPYRPGPAARTMPSLTPNFIFRGARLATITVFLPIRASGA